MIDKLKNLNGESILEFLTLCRWITSLRMAEKGAHLTQTFQSRPSVFDFIAHEALNDLLYPSAKKIIETLALRSDTFVSVAKWFDEYFLLSYSLLQLHYLRRYGATFSEKFYGLQRVPLKNPKHEFLGRRELVLSFLAVSLFPYLRAKLNKIADEMELDHLPRTSQKQKIIFMRSVIYCNSGFNIIYQLFKFIQHLKFLSGYTDINSPLLWLAGVKLKYAEEASVESLTLRNFIPKFLQRGLEVCAFFIQFMNWWHTERGGSTNVVPVSPPPKRKPDSDLYYDLCPICHQKRNIDTALSTSGFVFCFKCITSYLMTHKQCPVTKLPATVNNLIRIYPPS